MDEDFARTPVRHYQMLKKGHSREAIRYYFICPILNDLPDRSRWITLKAICGTVAASILELGFRQPIVVDAARGVQVTVRLIECKGGRARIAIIEPAGAVFRSLELSETVRSRDRSI